MKKVLGRKQSLKPEDEAKWWDVINHIEDYVSLAEVKEATEIACERILKMTLTKKAAYCWSGGKDSLVISELCQNVGITACQCFYTDLEFPEWKKFLFDNAPAGCEMIYVDFDLDFLAKHPEMIFANGRIFQIWNRKIRQENFRKYLQEKNLDVVIIGHRTIDGNMCGKNGVRVQKSKGVLYAPIYDWSHELVFAFLHYNKIELPFIYKTSRGFRYGTHNWAERSTPTIKEGYSEIYAIDPSVVIKAAEKLLSARKFLEEMRIADSH